MRLFIERYRRTLRLLALAPGEARVAHDLQEPRAAVVSAKSVEELYGTQASLLSNVRGVVVVAGKPAGQVIRRVEVRQHDLLDAVLRIMLDQPASPPRRARRPPVLDQARPSFIPASLAWRQVFYGPLEICPGREFFRRSFSLD